MSDISRTASNGEHHWSATISTDLKLDEIDAQLSQSYGDTFQSRLLETAHARIAAGGTEAYSANIDEHGDIT
jgi:hypothetical protein